MKSCSWLALRTASDDSCHFPPELEITWRQREFVVADGHPFKAVADVLGHRHLSTTFIYTKVDIHALSQVALEWPQEDAS